MQFIPSLIFLYVQYYYNELQWLKIWIEGYSTAPFAMLLVTDPSGRKNNPSTQAQGRLHKVCISYLCGKWKPYVEGIKGMLLYNFVGMTSSWSIIHAFINKLSCYSRFDLHLGTTCNKKLFLMHFHI